ncbi:MAG: PEGA domain-containing protein [Nannocystaceae bacterium]
MVARISRWGGSGFVGGLLLLHSGCHGGASNAPGRAVALRVMVSEADVDADVYVDGQYVGQVRALESAVGPLRLAPGVHRVEVRKPGRFPVQRTVRVDEGAGPVVEVRAELLADPR